MRTVRRPYGKEQRISISDGATHVVKMGFDARAAGAQRPVPGKLPGFLICRDSLGNDNNRIVDLDAMMRLGECYTAKAIETAKKLQLKAPDGTLPTELKFFIPKHAVRAADGRWNYPGTMVDDHQCYDKRGLFCRGDGQVAFRRQNDGTTKEIACVPVSATGAAAETFCKYSCEKACRPHSRLILGLYTGEKSDPQPLVSSLGHDARFRLDTSSNYNPGRIYEELDRAADRLSGQIAWLTGVITMQIQNKRTGDGVGKTQQLMFALSEEDIHKREVQMWERRVAEGRILPSVAVVKQLEGNTAAVSDLHTMDAPQVPRAPVVIDEHVEDDQPEYVDNIEDAPADGGTIDGMFGDDDDEPRESSEWLMAKDLVRVCNALVAYRHNSRSSDWMRFFTATSPGNLETGAAVIEDMFDAQGNCYDPEMLAKAYAAAKERLAKYEAAGSEATA